VQGTPVFVAALLLEALVIVLFLRTNVGFLWYNVIGCTAVVLISAAASAFLPIVRGPATLGKPEGTLGPTSNSFTWSVPISLRSSRGDIGVFSAG
jgi:hypothetical protein